MATSRMDWYHEVDEGWLIARKGVLTATEISKLVSPYKRFPKKRVEAGEVNPAFAALWGEKTSDWPVDVTSYGAAARGHVMEPYAVDEYSRITGLDMFHWDDCLLCNGAIGFSPDGLDVHPTCTDVNLTVGTDGLYAEDGLACELPTRMLEVKSFEPASHMKAIVTPKYERDQLMQLAVAFHVLPSLDEATLMFFCPPARIPIFLETYTRDSLSAMIDLVDEIVVEYNRTNVAMMKMATCMPSTKANEMEIWREHMDTRLA